MTWSVYFPAKQFQLQQLHRAPPPPKKVEQAQIHGFGGVERNYPWLPLISGGKRFFILFLATTPSSPTRASLSHVVAADPSPPTMALCHVSSQLDPGGARGGGVADSPRRCTPLPCTTTEIADSRARARARWWQKEEDYYFLFYSCDIRALDDIGMLWNLELYQTLFGISDPQWSCTDLQLWSCFLRARPLLNTPRACHL
jgi:hypothetical protein